MGCKDNLFRFIVLGSLITGFGFGIWVLGDCRYLENTAGELEVGVFRYSLNRLSSPYNTDGECVEYNDKAADGYVRTAQVCATLAPIFGLILIVLISIQQCCCNIPCSGLIVSISYTGAQVSVVSVWNKQKALVVANGRKMRTSSLRPLNQGRT